MKQTIHLVDEDGWKERLTRLEFRGNFPSRAAAEAQARSMKKQYPNASEFDTIIVVHHKFDNSYSVYI